MFAAGKQLFTSGSAAIVTPPEFVSSGQKKNSGNINFNVTIGESTCIVVAVQTIFFFGNGWPTITTASFGGTNLTTIQDRFNTAQEPGSSTISSHSFLFGLIQDFSAGTYNLTVNISGAGSGYDTSAGVMTFKNPVTGFGSVSIQGGTVQPSDSTTRSVTISSAYPTSFIGYGGRQSNNPLLTGGTNRVNTSTAFGTTNTNLHLNQVDNATSQTFSTTGGVVAGFALTY